MRINETAEAKPGFHQNWIRMDFYEQRESKPLFIVLSYWFEKKSRHVDLVEWKTADYFANREKKKKNSQHVRETWLSYSKGLQGKPPKRVIRNKKIW